MESLGVPLLIGAGFGFALDRGLVTIPLVIQQCFNFTNFTMLRMFLSAAATSSIATHLLNYFGVKPLAPRSLQSLGSVPGGSNLLGGLLLGSGMAITGSCPGTVWSQIGSFASSGQTNLLISRGCVVLGGIIGALVMENIISNVNFRKSTQAHIGDVKKKPHLILNFNVLLSLAMFIAVFGIDQMFPWRTQVTAYMPLGNAYQFDPMLAGIMLGSLQIPLAFLSGNSLGSSGGWLCIGSKCSSVFSMGRREFETAGGKFQAIQALGAVLGGALSNAVFTSMLGGYPAMRLASVMLPFNPAQDVFGGVLLLAGARLAGGCTSGHGITGTSNLGVGSFITVAGMFAGGILTVNLFPNVLASI